MGYYTRYDLSKNSEFIVEAIEKMAGESLEDDTKWYNCRKHMKAVSLQFPGVMLHVKGMGEENGDIWQAFYKDGRECYQKAQITFPDYTPADWH